MAIGAHPDLRLRLTFLFVTSIFTRGISGMITAWGGANSHMSIRAKELGIPAAIGVGEAMHLELSKARSCRLDCRNKRIEVMS